MKVHTFIAIVFMWLALPASLGAKSLRAGLFVGSNEGNFGEDELFYANEDALKMYMAFSEFGGLDRSLGFWVKDATVGLISSRLRELGQRITMLERHNDFDFECFFYFSGHGGSDGLHIDGKVYPYRELYDDIHALGCDLLVVILDSCNSGNFLRAKGVNFQQEEFRVRAYNTKKGEIFITSSADSEFSQEKDEFKGSVFTFYLVNGLLGAADANRDGQVTLSEAYNFSSRQTIRETFGASRGFQVPTYKYEMEGTQDAVLTDFGSAKDRVIVPGSIAGMLTFMDTEKGIIWGDFQVGAENRKVLLPRGKYLVRLRDKDGTLHLARCDLKAPGKSEWTSFEVISKSQDPIKGRRVYHHWSLRVDGGVHWSGDSTVIRGINAGGSVAVLVDNVGIPPVYAGVALSVSSGTRNEVVFETDVRHESLLFLAEGLIGLSAVFAEFFELSGEFRVGGGYTDLTRSFAGTSESTKGAFFQAGIRGQTIWWLSRNIGLVLPALQVFLLSYDQGGTVQTRIAVGANGGFQFRF